MVAFDAGATLARRFRAHAGDQQHLYGYAMRALAADWETGGATREICAGYEHAPPGASVQLRLLAGVFRLVLTGRAPQLRPYYLCLGGNQSPAEVGPVLLAVVGDHVPELHQALAVPPQTNEVGRSAALLAGLYDVAAASGLRRVRVLELGASAGLNLLLSRFCITGEGWAWGPPDSSVRLERAVQGPAQPGPLAVVDALGCDPDPVDPTSAAGRLLLTSFVWPFDLPRHERLAGALALASKTLPHVERGTAAEWLATTLAHRPAPAGVLEVVWHSISALYWPSGESEAVAEVLAEAGRRRPVARIEMEYLTPSAEVRRPELRTTLHRPGLPPRVRELGTVHDHGVPVWLTGGGHG